MAFDFCFSLILTIKVLRINRIGPIYSTIIYLVVTGEKTGAFAEDSLFSNSHWTPGGIGLSMLSVTYAFDGWFATFTITN